MSLVETALRKLKDARIPAEDRESNAAPIVASVVTPAVHAGKRVDIDREALRIIGLLPPAHQEQQIADQYRQIKRPLIANALGKGVARLEHGHLVMMASALPGEGKTFTSINLAISMALEKDIRVLLVDADVAKPHISTLFGLEKERGLLDVLLDETLDVEALILRTNIGGLSILPAGRRTETATELLASKRMEQIVARIGARDPNRIALFDSPPLLLTSESRALAQVVGQVVLVVRAGITPQKAVVDAVSYIVTEGKSVGMVLNRSETAAPGRYYGYEAYGESSERQRA